MDFSAVSDREILDTGTEFCAKLSQAGPRPKPADFTAVAQELAVRFDGRLESPSGDPVPEGPDLLSAALGASAVRHFCPSLTSALP